MRSLQVEFEALVKNPNKPNTGESLKFVALALWYENFVPNVQKLSSKDVSQAGYLLDKLTRYNCLDASKKNYLRSKLLADLERRKNKHSPDSTSKDMLVKKWGATVEMKTEFRGLMAYQRRSYKSSTFALSA
ncbi:hypothetical protein [Thalassotalea sp. ND16A]|uniref:hypothetical protein n=1 Tax=Thalassotalea sp. ND16A TaxID=1535422 RepID=UPI00051A02F0|nr:hypothetical protein [Thalassotalea sp. ND16A]KGJ90180.1 hypothetical protein ND16A_2030 [Thalassotalea sp. ND16A]